MTTIVIDSNQKLDNGSHTNFTVQLDRAITNVSKCTLLFANIPIPNDYAHIYMNIQIPEIGVSVRSGNQASFSTFPIGLVTAPSYRNIYQSNNEYLAESRVDSIAIDRLSVRISDPDGNTVTDSGQILMILKFE
jgi:hypothetical protein